MNALQFLILALATYRLALMVSKEDGPAWVFRRLRALVKRKAPKETALQKGVSCEWCMSVWTGGLVAGSSYWLLGNPVYDAIVLALALSAAAVIINQQFTKT